MSMNQRCCMCGACKQLCQERDGGLSSGKFVAISHFSRDTRELDRGVQVDGRPIRTSTVQPRRFAVAEFVPDDLT